MITQDTLAKHLDQARWHGRYFSCVCPFHDDDKPSLLVFEDGAYCLGCRKRISLDQLLKKVAPHVAPPLRQRPTGYWMNWPSPEDLSEEAHALLEVFPAQGNYLRKRGIDSRSDFNRLGWWEGFYTFPGYDERRQFKGLVVRADESIQEATGIRYMIPPGQESFLYVPDWRRVQQADRVFVTYGVMDALALAVIGLPVVTTDRGQTEDETLFEGLRKELVILPDFNGHEIDSARNLASKLGWRGKVVILEYPDKCKDPADYLKLPNGEKKLLAALSRF